ncbi:MAG: serine--tRNA ligase [Clostridiales bacterium]|nr:serine--tRNA ligase [Clostridiales bacterium]
MIDIRFLRENPDVVRENIRKKFQDEKLPLVDEVIALDAARRAAIAEVESLKAARNKLSKANGPLYGRLKKCADDTERAAIQAEIDKNNAAVKADDERRAALDAQIAENDARIREIMYTIPNIIDPSVPIGPDDSHNVEVQRFGEPLVPDFEVPHHVDIMARFDGIDKDAAGRVAGMGFYYLLGDIARLHEAVLAYARDFMIDRKGFTYVIPPFMMHGDVVKGVMSQTEMDAMMYKIEGEDLYLIGTSEHSMIGRFIDQILPEAQMPLTLTSYSPCFRKEVGSHGLEERGVYRIHQFEKQEMIVVCRPEESMDWYDKLWRNSVELFRDFEIPVRQLECCSGDLADLKVKSCDIEAWSPRQQKYFEVCSCSNLGDAQARRLNIRIRGEDGKTYLAHTLNNTCVAPPRMLIAFLENHLQADGSVTIPKCLQPYMGDKEVLIPKH